MIMRSLCRSLSVITTACFVLFVCGCEEGSTAQSGPIKAQVAQAGQSTGQAETVTKQKIGPKIEFESTLHNFGEIAPGTTNICEFKFKNVGDETLRVGKVRASCGCTAATLTKNDYKPGEDGVIRVKYHSDQQPGPKSKHLYVPSNDREQPKVRLIIDAHIVYKVVFEPEKLKLQLNQENAGCPEVTLESKDGKPFAITSVHSSKNCITADFEPKLQAKKFVLQPKVNMDVLNEHLKGEVDFRLSHPQCRVIKIPYSARPLFRFSPPSVVIFDVGDRKTVEKEVMLYSNYDMDFEIDSTSSNKGLVKVRDTRKIDKQYKLVLEITPPVSNSGRRLFTDTLTVSMKDGRQVKLLCRGFYKREGR